MDSFISNAVTCSFIALVLCIVSNLIENYNTLSTTNESNTRLLSNCLNSTCFFQWNNLFEKVK